MKFNARYLLSFDDVTKLLEEQMQRYGIKGVSAAMVHDGEICYKKALGVKNTQREPMTEETLNEAASLTKTLFGTLVMRLVQEGKMELDRPIMEVFKGKAWSDDPRFWNITPRQCLCHSCGMPNWQEKPIELIFDPGTSYSYSGEGYFLLQHMVEQLEGKDLTALLKEYFLGPLGMNNSTSTWAPDIYEALSYGFGADGEVVKIRDERRIGTDYDEPCAAWSLYSNAFDMIKFLQYIVREHGGLNMRYFEEMCRPQSRATEEIPWGLGWGLCEKDSGVLWHWGDNDGFKSLSILDWKTKNALSIFTNSDCGFEFWEVVASELTDAPIDDIAAFVKIAE